MPRGRSWWSDENWSRGQRSLPKDAMTQSGTGRTKRKLSRVTQHPQILKAHPSLSCTALITQWELRECDCLELGPQTPAQAHLNLLSEYPYPGLLVQEALGGLCQLQYKDKDWISSVTIKNQWSPERFYCPKTRDFRDSPREPGWKIGYELGF